MRAFWKTTTSILSVAACVLAMTACQKTENAGGGSAGAPSTTVNPSSSAQAATGAAAPVTNKPPFGILHSPEEGATVKGATWAYGWALDDSGIARITMRADTGATSPVALNQPFPGVAQSYPGYPNADKAGFGFAIPKLTSGIHTLTVTIVANDGGQTEIARQVRVP